PKVSGELERGVLKKFNPKNIMIAPKSISTRSLVALSDLVVSQNSTVGIQAIFSKKPSLFLTLKDSSYSNFAIKKGWIPKIDTDYMYYQHMYKFLYQPKAFIKTYQKMDRLIPRKSVETILKKITNFL
ncbi:hypothetical protein MJH12_11345, partial [bacterium]|nr:hypothetical protein [bacterium]